MSNILIMPPGVLTRATRARAKELGFLVIETDQPDAVKVIEAVRLPQSLGADELGTALAQGLINAGSDLALCFVGAAVCRAIVKGATP